MAQGLCTVAIILIGVNKDSFLIYLQNDRRKNDYNQNNIGLFIGIGTAIGTSLGVSLGTAFDNIGLGISLGISFGAGIGIVLWTVIKKVK